MADAGGRKALKARPVDVGLRMQILRSVDDVMEDATVSRFIAHGHQHLDRENEEVRPGFQFSQAGALATTTPTTGRA